MTPLLSCRSSSRVSTPVHSVGLLGWVYIVGLACHFPKTTLPAMASPRALLSDDDNASGGVVVVEFPFSNDGFQRDPHELYRKFMEYGASLMKLQRDRC